MHDTRLDYLNLWSRQLIREHRRICWQHGVELPPVLVEISAATGYWGQWQPATRTICLAERLILQHPWEVVLNVFRHEMAHQLVSAGNHTGGVHGPEFARACERLGVPPEFRRAGTTLPLGAPLPMPPEQDQARALLDKVRKLLALSESANEHESALALAKARELLARHRLTSPDGDAVYCSKMINLNRQRLAGHHRLLATLLIDFFQVEVVLAETFNAAECRNTKCLDLIGRPGQVKVAEYVYVFLSRRLELLWQRRRKSSPSNRRGRNSFYLGVLRGFQEKLARRPPMGECEATGERLTCWPIPLSDPERDRFLAHRYPRLVKGRRAAVRVDAELYRQGQREGRRLELREGIEERRQGTILPLEGPAS